MQFNGELDHVRSLPESEWRVELYRCVKEIGGHVHRLADQQDTMGTRVSSLEQWRERLAGGARVAGFAVGSGGVLGLIAYVTGLVQ